jgi:hypothetical protein
VAEEVLATLREVAAVSAGMSCIKGGQAWP